MSLEIQANPVLAAALEKGGQFSELFLEISRSLAVVMDDGQVEKVISGVDQGAGLRLVHSKRTAYAYTNQADQAGLMPLARNLAAMAQDSRPTLVSPRPVKPGPVHPVSKPPQGLDTRHKVDLVRAAEAAARAFDPLIRQVRVSYMERVQEVRVLNSLGVDAFDQRTRVILVVHCVAAENGMLQTGYESAGGSCGLELFDREDPQEVARTAARRAVTMLKADPAPGGAMPVVLSSAAGGTMIHEAVGHGLEGDHVAENMSVYAGRLGQKVASPLITVVDDSTLPGRLGSFGFDDEGLASRRTVLIEKGVLKSLMHDRLSAIKLEAELTGNGRRESYAHRPVPRMTNTLILPGADDPASVIRQTPQGLLVKKMGGGQVNTVNGDFVFEVSEGYLIKDGRVGAPVRGATLIGNGPQVLMEIDRVANDLGYSLGTCGKEGQGVPVADAQPTLRIPRIVVGGQQRD